MVFLFIRIRDVLCEILSRGVGAIGFAVSRLFTLVLTFIKHRFFYLDKREFSKLGCE